MTTTFVLQPGIYLVQLHVPFVEVIIPNPNTGGTVGFTVPVLVNGNQISAFTGQGVLVNNHAIFPVTGNKLLQITDANTVVGFNAQNPFNYSINALFFNIIFTRLQ